MTNKLSEFPAATTLAATDILPLIQAGANKTVPVNMVRGQKVSALTSASGVLTVDLSLGDYFTVTLTENITSIVFTNAPASGYGQSVMMWITQHASSAKTVAWPASFKWAGGTPETVSSTLSARDALVISTLDAGVKWDATLSKGRA